MSSEKELGTKAFVAKDFPKAIEHFTNAIGENPQDHALYSNRSACYYSTQEFEKALEDADKCIEVKEDWAKGYMRRGLALAGQNKLEDAIDAYEKGLSLEPENAQLKSNLASAQQAKARASAGPFGGPPGGGAQGGGMFGPEGLAKLMTNPKTAAHMQDPQFKMMLQMCGQNP